MGGTLSVAFMDAQEFVYVADTGRRWSEKSLAIARAVLVEGRAVGETAKSFDVSPQHVNVLKTRFLKRADDVKLQGYISQVQPDGVPRLREYSGQIATLHQKGYSAGQIADYLDMQGVAVTIRDVKKFVKGLE